MNKDAYSKIKEELAHKKGLLFWDIETRPMQAWIWKLGKQYITHEQVAEESKVISIQWMFEGDKKVSYLTWDDKQDDKKMLREFLKAIADAKVAVSQNGKQFDHKVLNWRLNVHKLPPMPRMVIFDTLTLSRAAFRAPSHKLDYRSKIYGLGGKIKMALHNWIDVIAGQKSALSKMAKYGCKDVEDLRNIFWRELPYYKSLPAELNLLVNPPQPKPEKVARPFCPMCAKKHQARFNVMPLKKKTALFLRCKNCHYTWQKVG